MQQKLGASSSQASVGSNLESMPDWQYARLGISLLLNNEAQKAEKLFSRRPESTQVKAAHSFLLFMNALMSFEEEKLQLALADLKETERRCANESYKLSSGGGWFKSVKDRLMSSSDRPGSTGGRKTLAELQKERSDELERRVISADCQLCGSLLTLLQQDLAGYMRGAWALRRAWRAYRSAHSQILRLYREAFRDENGLSTAGPVSPVNPNWEPTTPATPGGTAAFTPVVEVAPCSNEAVMPVANGNLNSIATNDPKRRPSSSSSEEDSYESCEETTQSHSNSVNVQSRVKSAINRDLGVMSDDPATVLAGKREEQKKRAGKDDKRGGKTTRKDRDGTSLSFSDTDDEDEAASSGAAYFEDDSLADKEAFGNNGYIQQPNRVKQSKSDATGGGRTELERPSSLDWGSRESSTREGALRWESKEDISGPRSNPVGGPLGKNLRFHGTDQQRVLDEAARDTAAAKNLPIDPENLSRLMSAVSFGYGVFQLAVSLLPPSLLRVVHFLGFEGDRGAGLASLAFARQGCDMRAPMATLALLWYHTIVRPFFAIDGSAGAGGAEGMTSEISEAARLIDESKAEFSGAALFLFFEGRVERLKCDLPAAVQAYERSARVAVQQEIQLLCLHEIGWCRLMQRDFPSASRCFEELKSRSRWSRLEYVECCLRIFYTFLTALCKGAAGREADARAVKSEILDILSSSDHKEAQVEKYIGRRVLCFPDPEPDTPADKSESAQSEDRIFWRMYLYEMLILWNAFTSCRPEEIEGIIKECSDVKHEPAPGLSSLILGASHAYFSRWPEAERSYRLAIEQSATTVTSDVSNRSNRPRPSVAHPICYAKWDDHIAAFAKYELAVVLMVQDLAKNREEVKKWLHEAQQYRDYDFENRLNVRIHAALKRASEGSN